MHLPTSIVGGITKWLKNKYCFNICRKKMEECIIAEDDNDLTSLVKKPQTHPKKNNHTGFKSHKQTSSKFYGKKIDPTQS